MSAELFTKKVLYSLQLTFEWFRKQKRMWVSIEVTGVKGRKGREGEEREVLERGKMIKINESRWMIYGSSLYYSFNFSTGLKFFKRKEKRCIEVLVRNIPSHSEYTNSRQNRLFFKSLYSQIQKQEKEIYRCHKPRRIQATAVRENWMVAAHRGYKTFWPRIWKLARRMGIIGCKLTEISALEGARLGSLHKAKSWGKKLSQTTPGLRRGAGWNRVPINSTIRN